MSLLDRLFSNPKDRFAELLRARLIEATGVAVTYQRDQFALVVNPARGLLPLHNAYAQWEAAPKQGREAVLAHWIAYGGQMVDDPDDSWAGVQDLLMPFLGERGKAANARLVWGEGPERRGDHYDAAHRVIGEDYAVMVGIDRPAIVRIVSDELMAEWGVDFDAVLDRALENLRAASPCRFERRPDGLWQSGYEDLNDCSRLLLPHLMDQLDLKGDPVALPYDRKDLFVAGSEDPQALAAMTAIATEPDPRGPEFDLVGLQPLVFRDGAWRSAGPDVWPDFARLRRSHAEARDMAWREPIEAYLRDAGRPERLAPLLDFGPVLMTEWDIRTPALLPQADVVALLVVGFPPVPRRWADVEAICGAEVQRDIWPPRYRVAPATPEQWSRLMAAPRPDAFPGEDPALPLHPPA